MPTFSRLQSGQQEDHRGDMCQLVRKGGDYDRVAHPEIRAFHFQGWIVEAHHDVGSERVRRGCLGDLVTQGIIMQHIGSKHVELIRPQQTM